MRKPKYDNIILELLKKGDLLTAKQIYELIDGIDLATVYRVIQRLLNQKLIRELSIIKGESIYEYIKDEHQHALCIKCGKIHHIKVDEQKLISAINLDNFFVLEDIEITLKGSCCKI